tara:strand:+ start:17 stop:334 length:318 start_codon:yes stop_codon:yes gene_type:complete
MAKQTKEEYRAARRKQYQTKRRAIEDADPKLQRQLRQIEAQDKRRSKKAFTEAQQGQDAGVNLTHDEKGRWDSSSLNVRKVLFARDEEERRTKRAKAKFHARRRK